MLRLRAVYVSVMSLALALSTSAQNLEGMGFEMARCISDKYAPDIPFNDHNIGANYLFALSTSAFTKLVHPVFPRYSVRVKKTEDFCDTTVNSYTGYIDIEARHLFFYFFESRSNPDTDDVILWTNGGPGCSSSTGLFMELGPCRILDGNGTKFHPESWNSNANVFFIDQPIGTGYSYAEYGETVTTSHEAAEDVAAFVAIFFEHFSTFKGRQFHMAGESYAGYLLPKFASVLYDQNVRLVEAGVTPINLQSVMIGNGGTDYYNTMAGRYEVSCTRATMTPVLDIGTCVRMKQALPRCLKMLKDYCYDILDPILCNSADQFCRAEIERPFYATGNRNPYNIGGYCEGTYAETMCYSAFGHISDYLDRPEVREMLGVDPSLKSKYAPCDVNILLAFKSKMDHFLPAPGYVSALLERGVRVLIYVGKNDWACTHVGNEAWTLQLEWSGHDEFNAQRLRPWYVNDKEAGMMRSVQGFTFATINGAGHMAPYDKPLETLEMVKRWLLQKAL